jgi:hypothetical protein
MFISFCYSLDGVPVVATEKWAGRFPLFLSYFASAYQVSYKLKIHLKAPYFYN